MRNRLIPVLMAGLSLAFMMDNPAYRIYNPKGKEIHYAKMVRQLEDADIIFFGELHDNPIAHWLQRELTGDLHASGEREMLLGAEMFESDNQLLLDEYLGGLITEAKFEDEARLWQNYKTDYKPLLQFAFQQRIPFIATNVPRRYANLVYREGFEALDSLSPAAKEYLPPMPVAYVPRRLKTVSLCLFKHGCYLCYGPGYTSGMFATCRGIKILSTAATLDVSSYFADH